MSLYEGLWWLHVMAASVSIAFFMLRGGLVLSGQSVPRRGVLGVLPHVVDTLFLGSAFALACTIHQYPFVNDWLTAKVLLLVLYVALGSMALRGIRSFATRLWSFFGALATVAYIVWTAVHHSPAMPLAWVKWIWL